MRNHESIIVKKPTFRRHFSLLGNNLKGHYMWRVFTMAVVIVSALYGPEKFDLITPETTFMQNCLWGGLFGGVSGGVMCIIGLLLGFYKPFNQ
jgi:hypothetical protein